MAYPDREIPTQTRDAPSRNCAVIVPDIEDTGNRRPRPVRDEVEVITLHGPRERTGCVAE